MFSSCEHLAALGWGLKSWAPAGKGSGCVVPMFPPHCWSRPEGGLAWLAQGDDGPAAAGLPETVIKMLRQRSVSHISLMFVWSVNGGAKGSHGPVGGAEALGPCSPSVCLSWCAHQMNPWSPGPRGDSAVNGDP